MGWQFIHSYIELNSLVRRPHLEEVKYAAIDQNSNTSLLRSARVRIQCFFAVRIKPGLLISKLLR